MDKKKIILDTDIGDDIDDAFCLYSAVKNPNIELLGVTTVFHNTIERAKIAKKMLTLLRREDIPVYAGYGNLLYSNVDTISHTCQYTEDIDNYHYDNEEDGVDSERAVDFIINTVKKYGKDVTILAIGPYTNLGKAFLKAPDAMNGANIVLMGGDFVTQFREWNVLCDADASKIVADSTANVTYISLQVTKQTFLPEDLYSEFKSKKGDEAFSYLQELVRLWQIGKEFNPCLHDPLTLFYVVDNSLVKTEPALVKIETEGEYSRGLSFNLDYILSYVKDLKGHRKQISTQLDLQRFFKLFFETIYM